MRPKREKKKRGGFFLALFLLAAGFTGGMGAAGALAVYFSELPLPLITPPTRDGDQDIAKLRERERRETMEFHKFLRQEQNNPAANAASPDAPNDFGLQPVGPDSENQPSPAESESESGSGPDSENAQPDSAPGTAAIAKPAERVFVYHLQVAVFRDRDSAETLRGEMALNGREASVRADNPDDPKSWRVRLGPFADERQAEEQRALLALEGYNNVSLLKSVSRKR